MIFCLAYKLVDVICYLAKKLYIGDYYPIIQFGYVYKYVLYIFGIYSLDICIIRD